MTQELNKFELSLVELVLENNCPKYGWLKEQLSFLKVKSREFSTVGGYINFALSDNTLDQNVEYFQGDFTLSAPRLLRVKGTDDFMSFELDITRGRINFMELVVDGRWIWNGLFDNMEVVDDSIELVP